MAIDAINAASLAAAGPAAPTLTAGYGAGVADAQAFRGALDAAAISAGPLSADALSPALKSVFTQLERVNGEARAVAEYADAASASGNSMTPGEIIQLTMRCHEFMFHCQLSSNVANRTSDGLQQLFRQQS